MNVNVYTESQRRQTVTAFEELLASVKEVRRWLVTLAVLKALAIGSVAAAGYGAVYFALDHFVSLPGWLRICLLTPAALGLIYLLYRLLSTMAGHISAHRAANFLDGKFGLEQQLVAAVEYHEQGDRYPYSKTLADQLMRQVVTQAAPLDFRRTVPKRHAFLWIALILLGLAGLTIALHKDYARLLDRLASSPLPGATAADSTQLLAVTGDVVVEPESLASLAARIEGTLPAEGVFVAEPLEKGAEGKTVHTVPAYNEKDEPQLAVQVALPLGKYAYHFEAGKASTDSHTLTVARLPKIERMTARITPPSARVGQPSTLELKDPTLETFSNSDVVLDVTTTEPVTEATVTDPKGNALAASMQAPNQFSVTFKAQAEGFLRFKLTKADGLANDNLPGLQVLLKKDEPPQFKLESPGSDYLATNVASVPLSFDISDDFGLEAANLVVEVAGQEPKTIPATLEPNARQSKLQHTLELEDYNLELGDHVVFYATAKEVDAGLKPPVASAASELYFIEIKPYRQVWYQVEMGLPSQDKQGLDMPSHAGLKRILEYTRALLKKTWTQAQVANPTQEDVTKLESMTKDARNIVDQLELLRLDPRMKWTPEQNARLNEAKIEVGKAASYLSVREAKSAVPPERKAYTILRSMLKELERVLLPEGAGQQKDDQDKVAMEEQAHLTRFENERVQWELKRLADKIEALQEAQADLNNRYDHFLNDSEEKQANRQKTTDERSWTNPNERPPENTQQPPNDAQQDSAKSEQSGATVEGALSPPPENQAPSQGSSPQQQQQAGRQAQMRMMRAQQNSLRTQAEALKEALDKLSQAQQSSEPQDQSAQQQLEEAMRSMEAMGEALEKAEFAGPEAQEAFKEAREAMARAGEALERAQEGVGQMIEQAARENNADRFERAAAKLARLADEYEQTDDPARRRQIEEEMDRLRNLFKNANLPQAPLREGAHNAAPGRYTGAPQLSTSYTAPGEVPKEDIQYEPAELARFTAREFWSRALEVRQKKGELGEPDASDVEFQRFENQFFEETAKYGSNPE